MSKKKDKKYDKTVRKVTGKTADAKKKAVHAMVEAIIQDDTDGAEVSLKNYLQITTRTLILGEGACSCDSDPCECDDSSSDDTVDDSVDDSSSDDSVDDSSSDDSKTDDKKDSSGSCDCDKDPCTCGK